jgi:rubrerythrin
MAYIKYLYFAKRAREAGAADIAQIFEDAATLEMQHAFAHLDQLYPKFNHMAFEEGYHAAAVGERIQESRQHATDFKRILEIAAKRLAMLAKTERRHASKYRAALEGLAGGAALAT